MRYPSSSRGQTAAAAAAAAVEGEDAHYDGVMIDVDLQDGQVGSMMLYPGSDPLLVAREFVVTHGLPEEYTGDLPLLYRRCSTQSPLLYRRCPRPSPVVS